MTKACFHMVTIDIHLQDTLHNKDIHLILVDLLMEMEPWGAILAKGAAPWQLLFGHITYPTVPMGLTISSMVTIEASSSMENTASMGCLVVASSKSGSN